MAGEPRQRHDLVGVVTGGAPLVAGVDSSTQSTKVVLRRLDDGAPVAEARAPHPATEPPRSEQDPLAWWLALVEAFGGLGSAVDDVVAISVSGQQHGLVVVGADDRPIRPAKLWNDTTSAPQADRLVASLGAERWAEACGVVPVAAITVTKLAWLAEHEPESVDAIRRIMLPHDYLTWRLTGSHVTDRGDASGTGWWDAAGGAYVPELLASAGVDRDLDRCLPQVVAPDESAGTITTEAAAALGLSPGVIVGPGSGDNMAASLGLGLRRGELAMSLGTSGTVFAVADQPSRDPSGLVAGFADANGAYLPLACTLNATKVTDMIGTTLGLSHVELADLAVSPETGAGAGGAVVVPWFDGERTPNLPAATGMITGLRPGTGRADLARAAHEGVLCNLLEAADALAAVTPGLVVDGSAGGELRLVGGGARSVAYQQILADLHRGPVRIPADDEAPATGAAVQAAAVAVGDSIDDVTDRWGLRAGGTVIEPGAAASSAAAEVRSRYRSAVGAAAELAQ
ncbi:MAG: xylulokinase [Actinomycetota bacterium]